MANILVVDDEEQLRTFLTLVLEEGGYDVKVAGDGIEALKSYHQHPVDLVITDIVMPEKEGIELIRELRNIYPKVKIIAMSGGSRNTVLENNLTLAKYLGADFILSKPFSDEEILEAIKIVLEG